MRFRFILFLLAVLLISGISKAGTNAGDQGYGLIIGNPIGLSGKVWFSDRVAMDGAVGINQGDFGVHFSFLFHDFDVLRRMRINQNPDLETPVYFGVGPRLIFSDNDEFGIRLPVGVSLLPKGTPWEFFVELAPVLRMTPDTGLDGDFALGARYYFDAIRPRN